MNAGEFSSSSPFRIRLSGLFPVRINLEQCIWETFARTPWTGDWPCRKAATYTGQQKRGQTSMPRMGFELTIPAFERAKKFHALDHATTVIGGILFCTGKLCMNARKWNCTFIDILDNINRTVFYLFRTTFVTGFCLRPLVKSLFNWAQSIELVPISETLF
jgi:hypothetical protein